MVRPRVRLHVPDPLSETVEVTVAGDRAHYLRSVMRLGPGDGVLLFNGVQGEWWATLTAVAKSECRLRPDRLARPQAPEPGPWMLFAPLKKSALDVLVEKATELGVERMLPVLTRHTVVDRVNIDRLRAQAREAAEQCGRLTLPDVLGAAHLAEILSAWPRARPLFMMDERGAGEPVGTAFAFSGAEAACTFNAAILVGPEGGFATEETELLARQPFVRRVSLGPRILRAETAAMAALACWQALAGDWRHPRTPPSAREQG